MSRIKLFVACWLALVAGFACLAQVPSTGAGKGTPGAAAPAGCTAVIAQVGSNIVGCWDADLGVVLSGSNVTTWTDQSSNAYVLGLNTVSGESAPNSPTFNATSYGGKAGITFSAAGGQYLATTSAAVAMNSNASSFFVAINFTNSSATNGRIISFVASGQGADYNNATSVAAMFIGTGPVQEYYQNNVGSTTFSRSFSTASRLGVVFNNTVGIQYLNNTADSGGDSATFTLAATGQLSLANAAGSGTALIDGVIRRVVVTKSAASAGDRTVIDSFLQN